MTAAGDATIREGKIARLGRAAGAWRSVGPRTDVIDSGR